MGIHAHLTVTTGADSGITIEKKTDRHFTCCALEANLVVTGLEMLGYYEAEDLREEAPRAATRHYKHDRNGSYVEIRMWTCECVDGERVLLQRASRLAAHLN
jgi:hypothetical protein